MTTSKVTQIMSMLKSPEMPGMQKQNQVQGTGIAFGAFLGQTAGNSKQQELLSAESISQPVRNDSVNQTAFEREAAKSGYRENSISRDNPADVQSKLPQDANEKLQAFDKQVKEVIAEKLGISEEEVTQQMEAMGLTVMDLMDPSKLAGLVMELNGSGDIGGLLLDGNFQQILSQISELSQELAMQLNLTPEEMNQLNEQLKLVMSDNSQGDATKNEGQLLEETGVMSQDVQEVPTEQVKSDANVQSSVATTQANQQEAVDDGDVFNQVMRESSEQGENETAVTTQAQEGTQEQEDTDSSQTGEKLSDLSKETSANDKAENKQTHVTYQTITQNVGQGQTVEVTQTVVQTRVNVEDILRQVSQMTRVFVNQAESSVEMQLNPANLGKIYLQVVSREGMITAQIAAQNEAVKEALESQVATLKENMNQQGLKVEAIEVTIASHEFERNLEENQQNAARQQQEEEAAQNARRNLNLNSLDELDGAMSEEESLAAKMMAEQGNRMDVTA